MQNNDSQRPLILNNLKRFAALLCTLLEAKLIDGFSPARYNALSHFARASEFVFGPGSSELKRIQDLISSTTSSEREVAFQQFASHLCLIYEYQIGHLKDYSNIKLVVKFIIDVVVWCLLKGIVRDLTAVGGFSPAIFHLDKCAESKLSNKIIKTRPIASITLEWRISEMFTYPGLRKSSLSLPSKSDDIPEFTSSLLSPYTPYGEVRRPDIYGFRNVILYQNGDTAPDHWELLFNDAATLKHNKISDFKISSDGVVAYHHRYKPLFYALVQTDSYLKFMFQYSYCLDQICFDKKCILVLFSKVFENTKSDDEIDNEAIDTNFVMSISTFNVADLSFNHFCSIVERPNDDNFDDDADTLSIYSAYDNPGFNV